MHEAPPPLQVQARGSAPSTGPGSIASKLKHIHQQLDYQFFFKKSIVVQVCDRVIAQLCAGGVQEERRGQVRESA